MATEQEYWNRLRRAAIACLSTSLRHGSPAMMDVLCELERAVYDGMTETVAPVAPDPGLREAIAERLADYWNDQNNSDEPGYFASAEDCDKAAESVLAALAAAGLVIGERAMLTTADFEAWTMEWQDKDTGISEWFSEMPNGLALVRVIPNE